MGQRNSSSTCASAEGLVHQRCPCRAVMWRSENWWMEQAGVGSCHAPWFSGPWSCPPACRGMFMSLKLIHLYFDHQLTTSVAFNRASRSSPLIPQRPPYSTCSAPPNLSSISSTLTPSPGPSSPKLLPRFSTFPSSPTTNGSLASKTLHEAP